MVFMKSGCDHFMSKTEYPGLKQSYGINSAAQKTTILMKVATKFTNSNFLTGFYEKWVWSSYIKNGVSRGKIEFGNQLKTIFLMKIVTKFDNFQIFPR